MYRVFLALGVAAAFVSAGATQKPSGGRSGGASPAQVRQTTWTEARPIVERLEDGLPKSLRAIPAADRPTQWSSWLQGQRRALESRIAQGDIDSVVNLLLFGTSFTTEPRVTARLLADLNQKWAAGDKSARETLARAYQQRAADLVDAARKAGADARLLDVKRVLTARGHDLTAPSGRSAAIQDLLTSVARVREEAARLAQQLDAQRRNADSTAGLAERSRVFKDRGLSADSSVLTQFAIDRGVCALREGGVLPAGAVNRIAIVGPGLDFADKQEGFDFYPPQSLQPFTLLDSLVHCGLADRNAVSLTTLDVSGRVSGHLRAAVNRALRAPTPYRIILPWSTDNSWSGDALEYWKRAGNQIGNSVAVDTPPSLSTVRARGIDVAADIVRRIHPLDASVVSDRLEMADAQRFDLVLASNVLVYYDTFEQTLALSSIAAMLRPGGVLLTNDAVLEIPEIAMRSAGNVAVPFSNRPGDGERMIWYVKAAGGR